MGKHELRKKDAIKFVRSMGAARQAQDVEKAVETATMGLLQSYFRRKYPKATVTGSYPYNTDGLVSVTSDEMTFSVLVEAKRDMEFSQRVSDIPRVVAQVIYYLRSFITDGATLPKVFVCVDLDEIFTVPSATVSHYALDPKYDWSLAPSSAGDTSSLLYQDLLKDKALNGIFVHQINEDFDVAEFCEDLNNKAILREPIKIPVVAKSLQRVFDNFITTCLGNATFNLSSQRQREIFIRSLKGDAQVFPHPKKKNTLVIDGEEISGIDVRRYEAFWMQYSSDYSLAELDQITAMGDTLIEESERRFSGDFWTPQHWVDQANRVIEESLGKDWRDKYVVWDPACGSLNLTREGKFKNLFASTLFQSELSIAEEYNANSTKFQYDFLNDDVDVLHRDNPTREQIMEWVRADNSLLKIPRPLLEALNANAPIVFFANPPYAQSGSGTGKSKTGVTDTRIRALMDELGGARTELYTQFLYRIQKLAELFEYTNDFHIFFFTGATFLTGDKFRRFREGFFSLYEQKDGFMLNAGEFHGTSNNWGIIFSHFALNPGVNQDSFHYEVLQSDKSLNISRIAQWDTVVIPNNDRIKALVPVAKGAKINDAPLTQNGFTPPSTATRRGVSREGQIGYLAQDASRISGCEKYTSIYTTSVARGNGIIITRDNAEEAAVVFSVCRALYDDIESKGQAWIHWTDIIRKPDATLMENREFIADCMILSLFERKARQSSLRNYHYDGKTYDIPNEFFWLSHDHIQKLAEDTKQREIEGDLRGSNDRFVYTWIKDNENSFSKEASTLLDTATNILEKSFADRTTYHNDPARTEQNLIAWDAGWEQIRRMCFSNIRINDDYLDLRPGFDEAVAALKAKIVADYKLQSISKNLW